VTDALLDTRTDALTHSRTSVPRLGFLGVGWIGRHRMEAIARAGFGEVAAVSDPRPR
jgi:hypothetical protein